VHDIAVRKNSALTVPRINFVFIIKK